MRKFDQLSGDVTLAIMLGRDAVEITKADGPWYEITATTISNRRLVARFTLTSEGKVPEEVLNVMSIDNFNDGGETSHEYVRVWLQNNASAGKLYVQHFIYAYGMDDSKVFASYLGRECTEE